jgi:3-oxoadipate enol-lactonase/4-carboxymuconolactone decarboxylase
MTSSTDRLHAEASGLSDAPWLVLLHSLGSSLRLWDRLMPAFEAQFRVLRVDLPGHGRSALAHAEDLEGFVAPLIRTLDLHGVERAHFCGISLGGLVIQHLALHHPLRVDRIVLANTAARIGTEASWQERIDAVRRGGIGGLFPGVTARWVSADFARLHAGRLEEAANLLRACSAEAYIQACAVLARTDLRGSVSRIKAPALVIAGDQDAATTPEEGRFLSEHIEGSRFMALRAAHLSVVEQPGEFARAVLEHCAEGEFNRRALYEAGMAVRRMVLGDAHVDGKRKGASPAMLEFQDYITESAWGQVWTRPGLSRRERSMLVMAITLTGNRESEFMLHLKSSRNNGVTRDEVKEVIFQAAVYAGVPAANHAMNLAESWWAQEDAASNPRS